MQAQVPTLAAAGETIIVIDIETAPPRTLPDPSSTYRPRTSATHEIAAIAALVATRQPDARWTVEGLHSWDRSRTDEFGILLGFDGRLGPLFAAGARIVTFNGLRHDLASIRRRAAFHRMFALRGWTAMLECRHRDLMVDGLGGPHAQWVALRDTCNALRIPSASDFPAAAMATVDATRRKCETDACSTFVLLLYTLAMEAADERELVSGWRALAAHVRSAHARCPHLMQFAEAADDQSI